MRVLLANPETSRSFYDFAGIIDDEPYELECLQAHLADRGIESEIWDGQFDKDFRKAFLSYKPDFVYFCGRTRQENFIKEYCEFCKSCYFTELEENAGNGKKRSQDDEPESAGTVRNGLQSNGPESGVTLGNGLQGDGQEAGESLKNVLRDDGQEAGDASARMSVKRGFWAGIYQKLKRKKYFGIPLKFDNDEDTKYPDIIENTSENKSSSAPKQVITIVGGIHAQNCPERFREEYIDYIVSTFDPEAVSGIIEGKDPEKIPGISRKVPAAGGTAGRKGDITASGTAGRNSDITAISNSGRKGDLKVTGTAGRNSGITAANTSKTSETVWVSNEKVPYDIKTMPWADRSDFHKYGAKYCYLELRPIAVIRTAYSCPYSCAFCYRNRLNCHRYTARDIGDVVDEIESIDCENIYIIDDDFLVNIHRLERFIELIETRNIHKKYVCFGRADFIAKYPHVIRKLAKIGFYYILTGLEYIENRRLNDTDKRNDVNTNVRALRTCREFGINMMGMFITDLDFTRHDFSNLYKWIRHFDLKHVAISIYTPEMCLENFEQYRDRLITDDPSEWDYLHVVAKPEKLSVRKYYFYYHILLIRLFLRAKRQGVYDFMDYKAFIKSFLKNLFRFGG